MDVEVAFPTAPRGPWCDAITRFTHYGPVFGQSLASTDAAWSTPRSHKCESTCFAGDVDVASLTTIPVDMTLFLDLEDPKLVDDRCSQAAPRKSPPRPSKSQQRELLDIRKNESTTPEQEQKRRFTFTTSDPETRKSSPLTFKFEAPPAPPRPSIKRARSAADVDGPNTAELSCKKRRLRLELITSRLSQPFSLPATHILNREALAAGDKRFLKMATHVEMVRRGDLNSSSSSFRRFAILNKTRATLRDCNWTELGGYLACRRPTESRRTTPSPSPPCSPVASAFPTPPAVVKAKSPLAPSKAAAQNLPSLPSPPPCSRQPAAVKPVSLPTSPLGRPIEPCEPDPERRSIYDEDDDCEAFPYTGYDSDDTEDVYSDFSAIFGAGTTVAATEDVHSFEDYLDELDGISWAVR